MPLETFVRRGLAAQRSVDRTARVAAAMIADPRFKRKEGCAPGVCRVCGCTQERACADSCSWITDDLCSTCATAILAIQQWMEKAYRPAGVRLIREARERASR